MSLMYNRWLPIFGIISVYTIGLIYGYIKYGSDVPIGLPLSFFFLGVMIGISVTIFLIERSKL
jgi:hypothetical protein